MAAIEAFVKKHINTAYFQSALFFKACSASVGLTPCYHAAYDTSDKIVGIMLSFRQVQYQVFPFNFLSSRTIIWGSPLVLNNDLTVYEGLYREYSRTKSASIYTQVRNLSSQKMYQEIMEKAGFFYEEHLNIIVDLTKTEEQLWQEVHSKRRNEIRRAIKEQTSVEVHNDLDTLRSCYAILKEVYQRAKLPLPALSHFAALLQSGHERDGLVLFVATSEKRIIGCMLCLAYGKTLFDYYAGAYSDSYHKYPNDMLPWEVFKWGKKNGFTTFDFGGAGKPDVPYGVREYKKKFGGEMVSYGRFEKIHFPVLYKAALSGLKLWKYLRK